MQCIKRRFAGLATFSYVRELQRLVTMPELQTVKPGLVTISYGHELLRLVTMPELQIEQLGLVTLFYGYELLYFDFLQQLAVCFVGVLPSRVFLCSVPVLPPLSCCKLHHFSICSHSGPRTTISRFVHRVVWCHHFALTSLPFCGVGSWRVEMAVDTSAVLGGYARGSSLKMALLGIRVRVGPRVVHRDASFHTAPDSLPGVTADVVGNRFELSHHFHSLPYSHSEGFCRTETLAVAFFRVSCLLSLCLPLGSVTCAHFHVRAPCLSILVHVGSILSFAITLKSVSLRS